MNAPQNDESVLAEYMSRDELAEDLNRCTRTLDRWHSLRIGPPRTIIGKRVLYRRQAVAEWLRSQEEIPTAVATIVLLVVTHGFMFMRAVA